MATFIHWLSDIFMVLLLIFGVLVLAGLTLDLFYITYRVIVENYLRKEKRNENVYLGRD